MWYCAVLPMDALLAHTRLVYCFAGGDFPTLFAALQVVEHCRWQVAMAALEYFTDLMTMMMRTTTSPILMIFW